MKPYQMLLMGLFLPMCTWAQVKISAEAGAAYPQAVLELESNDKGLLLPRLSAAAIQAIQAASAQGLLVYDLEQGAIRVFNGVNWQVLYARGLGSNTALGHKALANATGQKNTALGDSAGINLSSGSQNLLLGYQAQVPNPSGSQQMSIANLIYATGLGTSTSSIGLGNVGIGLNNPSFKLQVKGSFQAEKINVLTGSNAGAGLANLSGGQVQISSNRVTSNSLILISPQAMPSGRLYIASKTSGTGFTIQSTDANEALPVAWLIIN